MSRSLEARLNRLEQRDQMRRRAARTWVLHGPELTMEEWCAVYSGAALSPELEVKKAAPIGIFCMRSETE